MLLIGRTRHSDHCRAPRRPAVARAAAAGPRTPMIEHMSLEPGPDLLADVLAGDDLYPLIPGRHAVGRSARCLTSDVPGGVHRARGRRLLRCYAFDQAEWRAEGIRGDVCHVRTARDQPQGDLRLRWRWPEFVRRPPADRNLQPQPRGPAPDQLVHDQDGRHTAAGRSTGIRPAGITDSLGPAGCPRPPAGDLPWVRPAPVLNTSRLVTRHLP